MKTVLLVLLHVLAFSVCIAQPSTNQRILFGPIHASIGPGGRSSDIKSYCFDEKRDSPESFSDYKIVHRDGISSVKIGNKPPISFQEALSNGSIELIGEHYKSFQIKNKTNETISVDTQKPSLIGDVEDDKEFISENVLNLGESENKQALVWMIRALDEQNIHLSTQSAAALAQEIITNKYFPHNWLSKDDQKILFTHKYFGQTKIIEFNKASNKCSVVKSFTLPYGGLFVDKLYNDVFIVGSKIVKVGDRQKAIEDDDDSTLIFGENMSAQDVQGVMTTNRIRSILSGGESTLKFASVTNQTHDFSADPNLVVEDYSDVAKNLSFQVKKLPNPPKGSGIVGNIYVTVLKVANSMVDGFKQTINGVYGRLRGNSQLTLANELLKDLKARGIQPSSVTATMSNIDIVILYERPNFSASFCEGPGGNKNNETNLVHFGLDLALVQSGLRRIDTGR